MPRVQKITIRLNDIENRAIREMARNKQLSVSEYMRSLVPIKELKDCNFDRELEGQAILMDLYPELCSCNGGTTTPPLHQ